MKIIDMDIHPTGNSLGTIAEDEDVRFWTYPGSGNIQEDIFHFGKVNPAEDKY